MVTDEIVAEALGAFLLQNAAGSLTESERMRAALIVADRAAWKPIETAPRDRWVILYAPEREGLPPLVTPCLYHPDGGWCIDELREATHWRPLPEPPEAAP